MATAKQASSKTAVFIDGNWLLHRVFRTKGSVSISPERSVPLQLLNYCCVYALHLQASHGALVFDGDDNYRLHLYPNYKSSRRGGTAFNSHEYDGPHQDEFKDLLYKCLPPTIRLFRMVGFPVHQDPSYEADDLVAAGASEFSSRKGNMSWIVCRDKDALQMVRQDKIHVFWPEVGKNPAQYLDEAGVQSRVGMPPKTFGDYQILVGDSMDDVPGVVKPSEARRILKAHSTLSEYFKTTEGQKFFRRHQEELKRNLRLVRMDLRSWSPSEDSLRLDKVGESTTVLSEFGRLPKSFHALKSTLSRSRSSLF